jgi:hypothetical protein
MQGNLHVRFGERDDETGLSNETRRIIPTLPKRVPHARQQTSGGYLAASIFFPAKDRNPNGTKPRISRVRWSDSEIEPGPRQGRQPNLRTKSTEWFPKTLTVDA